jgi:PAS domain S-box-containing protein
MNRSASSAPSETMETMETHPGQTLLFDAATALLTSSSPMTLLRDLYARLADLTGLEVCGHFDEISPDRVIALGLSETAAAAIGRALSSCSPSAEIATVNEGGSPSLRAVLRSAGLKRHVCHPLLDGDRRVGTLLFATRSTNEIEPTVPDLLHRLARLVSATLVRIEAVQAMTAETASYRQMVTAIDECVCTIEMIYDDDGHPVDCRIVQANPAFERQTEFADVVGRTAREIAPDVDASVFEFYDEVAHEGTPRRFEIERAQRWYDIWAMRIGLPERRRVALVFRDISERKHRENNLGFLAEINADLAELSDTPEILKTIGRKIGEHIDLSRVAFAEVDEALERVRILHEWRREPESSSSVGLYRIADFAQPELLMPLKQGQPVALTDVRSDPRTADMAQRYAIWNARAMLHAPHRSEGRLKLVLMGAKDVPHAWRSDEIELLQELSTRVWLRLERAWAEETLQIVSNTAPVVLWMTDELGACTFVNRAWTALTGQSRAQALGRGWTEALHPEDRPRAFRVFAEAAARRAPFVLDYRLRGRDGDYRWAVESGMPRYDHEGRWLGYVGSTTDVHDRKMAEQKLREADRRKDQFLAVLSHELRNPLAPIQNGLRILDEVEPGSPAAERIRQIIRRQVEQLVRLVDDLLDVTRVTRGKIELRREQVDLVALVRDAMEDHRMSFDAKGVDLRADLADTPVFVVGDANRLEQAFSNLLQNAAKFTTRGDTVSVQVRERDGQALVRVADTGAGMEPGIIANLFEPFMQADESLARVSGGLGLGLALVRGIVELHGGVVDAHSEGLGRGSSFEMRFPLAVSSARPARIHARSEPPRRLSVLVVEDVPDVAETMRMMLEMEGHTVEIADDGAKGLEMARQMRPDVVLCDLGLPSMDGYDVARALASDPGLAAIRRVAISGYALPEDVERAKTAGFHHHLAKPASLEKLRAVLTPPP